MSNSTTGFTHGGYEVGAPHGSVEPVVVIVGAGPAGLTAAYEFGRFGWCVDIVEADSQVGGISRTVERDGWRFDLGGHRFFTKVPRVEQFWHEVLPPEDFLVRPRMSRIYYEGRFYDYPLRAMNALKNLGLWESIRCLASYLLVRFRPPNDQTTFEGWVASRFGWRLYKTFFKTYTEKVWGIPATKIQADWAAQRIKNLSLGKAVLRAMFPRRRNSDTVTSLIEQFQYPRLGPGMMWERCADLVEEQGSRIYLNSSVSRIRREVSNSLAVAMSSGQEICADFLISTMPINELIQILDPPAPENVLSLARKLKHRDFLTVALVISDRDAFPDNWIYIHSPEARVGRIQNFGSWSPDMVKSGFTCLGLEYFVSRGDDLWCMSDEDLVHLAQRELHQLSVTSETPVAGYVVRVPRAYPVYDHDYQEALTELRTFLEQEWPMIFPIGRNGMHRYNNQDHSMLTAMLTVENLTSGTNHDVWQVNVDDDYHEASTLPRGTGRSAPMIG